MLPIEGIVPIIDTVWRRLICQSAVPAFASNAIASTALPVRHVHTVHLLRRCSLNVELFSKPRKYPASCKRGRVGYRSVE